MTAQQFIKDKKNEIVAAIMASAFFSPNVEKYGMDKIFSSVCDSIDEETKYLRIGNAPTYRKADGDPMELSKNLLFIEHRLFAVDEFGHKEEIIIGL